MIKRTLIIGLWGIGILAFLAFEYFALKRDNNGSVSVLKIELKNKHDYPLLTSEDEIHTELLENYLPIENQKKKNLNLKQIEKDAGQISYLEKYDAYFYVNGILAIAASPRKAVLRIYNKAGQHFYLGADTVVMPLASKHSLRILFANGNLPKLNKESFEQSENEATKLPAIYKKIFILASKIQGDEFLDALIDQIYVRPDLEFELIPKAGVSYIEFGDINDADDKLNKLKNFYINGKEKINWTIYKSINLKYENQVVCTKK